MCENSHIHAELMAQYAEDAKKTDKPWKRWEFCLPQTGLWNNLSGHPFWVEDFQYRRKQPMIIVNGVEVPAPIKGVPEQGARVYVASVTAQNLYGYATWHGLFGQLHLLEAGLLHTTREAARQHSKAMLLHRPKEA